MYNAKVNFDQIHFLLWFTLHLCWISGEILKYLKQKGYTY